MAGRKSDFTLPTNTLDELFSSQEERDEAKLSKIRDIPLEEIDDFPDHPFKVREDEDMFQLVESIKERGVITPATVRQKGDGRYELISGHRRKKACELAGFETLRCEVVMARKYDLISELYNRTCKTVVSNPQNWQAFLASACRNYKLRYDEQLLVYAQRPDATAVLEIEQWNRIFGRWVNRGARGIAVFADENRTRQRLTHYFDISDTHESRYSRTVPIWDMRQEYEADVIETLESTFGEIENKSSLAEAIMGAARNAAEDNIPDYLQDLYYATEGSFLEEVDNDIVASIYKRGTQNQNCGNEKKS